MSVKLAGHRMQIASVSTGWSLLHRDANVIALERSSAARVYLGGSFSTWSWPQSAT